MPIGSTSSRASGSCRWGTWRTARASRLRPGLLGDARGELLIAPRVDEEAGAKALVLAPGVGSVKGADNYVDTLAYNVNTLAQALR